MKKLRNIFVLLLSVLGLTAYSQSQLITTILPVGGVVHEGFTFRVDVSVTYNTNDYTNYKLEMEIPSSVLWSQAFTTDVNSLEINTITNNGSTIFTIPFTPKQNGIKSTNFFLDNLLNNTTAICQNDILSTLHFTLKATQNGNIVTIATSESVLTTPKKTDSEGWLSVQVGHGQELDAGGTNTGTFPYYVDIYINWYNLKDLPSVAIKIPGNKLDVINAVKYNYDINPPPFHSDLITLGAPVVSGNIKTYSVPLPSTASTYYNNGDRIRIYFSSSYTGTLTNNEIEVITSGATYELCNLSTQSVADIHANLPGDHALITQTALYQNIEHKNIALEFCPQRCNFDVAAFTSQFYFEINSIYTQFGTNIPRVRVECPYTTVAIKSMQVPSGITSVKYTLSGSSVENTLAVSGNTAVFPNANVQYIYIENYAFPNDGNFAKDFSVTYSSLLSDLSSVSIAQRVFKVNYVSFTNTKVYTSEALQTNLLCYPGMRFRDDYENAGHVFVDNVSYYPSSLTPLYNSNHNIRITINPRDVYYTGNYTISNAEYILNNNMTLDPDNLLVLYSDNVNGPFHPLRLNSSSNNTSYYRNIHLSLNASQNKLIIHNINVLNNSNCGVEKNLYLMISTRVKTTASYTPGGYRSTLQDSGNSFTEVYNSTWNVERSIIDKVSAEVKVVCPGDGQETERFEKGQVVKVIYTIHNENQNPVKNLNYVIPALNNGTLVEGINYSNIHILGSPNQSDVHTFFAVNAQGTALLIQSNSSYVLNGNTDLLLEAEYLLSQAVAVGTIEDNITFKVNSFTSIDGIPRAEVEPTQKKSFTFVTEAECIPPPPCDDCVTSFSPIRGHEYLLSAWVKESYTSNPPKTYVNSGILITFNNGEIADWPVFTPAGPIIEGWQRIESSFVVPSTANNIQIEMVNTGDNNVYFDDIRIHPFRSNMKSFVYDPSTQRLSSELDENNYATFYEYDDEGALIRVKKETERGVMTITESRNNQSKIK